ncbi:MAG: TonB-dependent receptor [Chryseolinea sp.]
MSSRDLVFIVIVCTSLECFGQTASIIGSIKDRTTQQILVGAFITLKGTEPLVGTTSDAEGNFTISAFPGSYNITASLVGYNSLTKFNVLLTTGNISSINFELEELQTTLNEVVVQDRPSAEAVTVETPLSVQRLTTEEIRSNPGGNFDISRVIQALPGVGGATGAASFRNDIIVRGGAPNENVYYLDGIEIPVINHFSTQGSAGGPQGILNVSFIEDVTLSTSAFEAKYSNVLSSVLQFKQREGNPERIQGNVRLSASEFAVTLDGPLAKRTTFLASARRSYLGLIFKLIDLPIRPNYWDFQYQITHKINARTTLSFLGVGAIDRFKFAAPKNSTAENIYVLRSNPLIDQNSYTVGLSLRKLIDHGFINVSLSRNFLENNLDKFEDAISMDESLRTLKVRSREIENKVRLDVTQILNHWKYSAGFSIEYVHFENESFNVIRKEIPDTDGNVIQPAVINTYSTQLNFAKVGAFLQLSKFFFNNTLSTSFGLRSDINSFSSVGNDPVKTLSPRLSISYALDSKWSINASIGKYYKIPIYPILGYKQQEELVNRNARYIGSTHYVFGFQYLPKSSLRFTVEGFYKQYDHYLVSVRDGISIANSGIEFGQIGNEAIESNGKGRAYGIEIFAQQKLSGNSYFTISYTLFKSEFSGTNGRYIASSWDNNSLMSAILGRKFKRNWEVGVKFRYAGGSPYTPFDLVSSQRNYLSVGNGILDYERLNENRLRAFKQIDLRVDKKWNLSKATIDVFVDIQNIANFKSTGSLRYTFERNADNSDFATTDGKEVAQDGSNATPLILKENSGSILPTLGFIFEF